MDFEVFLFASKETPGDLRIRLSEVLGKIGASPSGGQYSRSNDQIADLERLGKLRESGVLTNEEFANLKADLLRR